MNTAEISIIIPTHNRVAQLLRLLDSLALQSYPMHQAEVIVVADACRDDTAMQVMRIQAKLPFELHFFEHEARNPGATRNLGASKASAELLFFLDDDMLASPGLVQAHVDAQAEKGIVLGYSRPVPPPKPSRWQLDARLWWEQSFANMQHPEHRFSYYDFFSGNVSMPARIFRQVGGFDTNFAGRLEDYELGLRLMQVGADFQFCIQARADHYDTTDLPQWLARRRFEGAAEILIAERHPETRASLEQAYVYEPSLGYRMLRSLAWRGALDGGIYNTALKLVHQLEKYNLRYRRGHLVYALSRYQYWRGQAERFPSQRQFRSWLKTRAPVIKPVKLDLSDVLADRIDEVELVQAAQHGVSVVLDGVELFTQPPTSCSEPTTLPHLKSSFRSWLRSGTAARLHWFLRESFSMPGLKQTVVAKELPPISVVVCTRDRPEQLARCLAALQKQDYPDYEVVVVDNVSEDAAVEQIISASGFRYVREERPGLDWARNRGWQAARHALIAFSDDDAQPEPDWLRWVAHAFVQPDVDVMTGRVEPLALETEAQRLFEVYGGMSKGKLPRRIEGAHLHGQHLLSAHDCGVGANMAFRRTALQKLGGFDTALDTGTLSGGAGDIDIFHRALVNKMVIRYQPSALVYHEHRRSMQALERQIEQNGRSFGVYLLKVWSQQSVPRPVVARYAAAWLKGWVLARVVRSLIGKLDVPRSLAIAELRGALDAARAFRATYDQDWAIRQKYGDEWNEDQDMASEDWCLELVGIIEQTDRMKVAIERSKLDGEAVEVNRGAGEQFPYLQASFIPDYLQLARSLPSKQDGNHVDRQ